MIVHLEMIYQDGQEDIIRNESRLVKVTVSLPIIHVERVQSNTKNGALAFLYLLYSFMLGHLGFMSIVSKSEHPIVIPEFA